MPRTRSLLPLLVLLALAHPALAVDGQIPIPNTPVYATPIMITAPGSYVVTRNLMPTGPGPIINIAVPFFPSGDVILDLHGFVLDNTPNPADPVIRVSVVGSSEATIRNGSLVGGTAGIEAFGPTRKVVVEDVKISDFTGMGVPGQAGIHLFDVENVAIRRCVIHDAAAPVAGAPPAGILLDGGMPRSGVIEDNIVRRTNSGIVVNASGGVEISNNQVLEIGAGVYGAGIQVMGGRACLVSENTVAVVVGGANGIHLLQANGCKLVNNVVSDASNFGIWVDAVSTDVLLLHNVVRSSGADGILVDGTRNRLEQNVSNLNGAAGFPGFGIHFGAGAFGNIYGRNTGVGNLGGPCIFPISPDFCDDNGFPPGPPNWSYGDNRMPGGLLF